MSHSLERWGDCDQSGENNILPNVNALLPAEFESIAARVCADVSAATPVSTFPVTSFTARHRDAAVKSNIGFHKDNIGGPIESIKCMESDKRRLLEGIFEKIGSLQVARNEVELAPSWTADEAFSWEFHDNWRTQYLELNEKNIEIKA